ncbi:MAG: AIR synthase related protein, partial [Acidobacteriaceae bacterium]
AVPVAATNCLNFGNPEKPEIMAQLSAAIDGIAEACTALGTPITGGNVSLYNETKGEGIYPTPVIGIVGILEDVSKAVPADFRNEGDVLLLLQNGTSALGSAIQELGSSAFAQACLGTTWGTPPSLHLEAEAQLHPKLQQLASERLITAARPVADGGVAVAIAEGCMRYATGVDVLLQHYPGEPAHVRLFGEHATQVVLACPAESVDKALEICGKGGGTSAWRLGTVTNGSFRIQFQTYKETDEPSRFKKDELVRLIDTDTVELREPWSGALQSQLSVDTVTA